jgi:diguanylate cyclase (GGDEF)-like protein/PAS domain S-box-containing protein
MAVALRLAMRRSRRSWVDVAAPLVSFPLIVMLRDATGGAGSGLDPLVAIPVFWLAIFGTRRDLRAAMVLVALTFLLPMVVLGPPDYPLTEWRRALLWTGLAIVVAPVLQRVAQQLAIETEKTKALAARFEGIVQGATLSSLITTDPDGRITTFGVGAERQLGHRAQDVVGKELTSLLLDPDELAAAAEELDVPADFSVLSRLAHQRIPSRTWTMLRVDGEPVFVRMAVTVLRDDLERVIGYLCVAIDSTTDIRSQQALTQAEERWRILMDHLPDTTVIMVEEKTGITVVTGAGLMARRLRDAAGRRLVEFVDRDEPGRLARMLSAAFDGNEVPPVYAMVDDAEHEFVASPLPSTAAERRQAILMVRDVSRERERERLITAAKERAERLFEDAPQGIALLRPDGVVVQANPALVALLGGTELTGRRLASLSFEPDERSFELHLERVRNSRNRRAEAQWSVRGGSGEEVHVVLISTVLSEEPGEVAGGDLILTNVVDVSERYRYERQLAFLAEHDPMTGLANRRRFDQALQRHVEDCRRYGPRGAVLMLDLDHFKEVNDTLGHATGDHFLVQIAQVLTHRLRSTDLVARLGGDEFAILLPHEDKKGAELVASSVVSRIRAATADFDDARRGVTVSAGGVILEEVHESASDLLSAADAALYVAKNSGRNQYAFVNAGSEA